MILGQKEIGKKSFILEKIWDVSVDNIVISKLIETKTNSKYFIGVKFNIIIRPLVLIIPKISGYVKTFNINEGDNKLMSFRICDE